MTQGPDATSQALRALEGNRPLLLEGSGKAWLIQSGAADVFAVRLRDGEPRGPRRHLFTADTGCLLFGWDLRQGDSGIVLVAVGVPGTQAREIHQHELGMSLTSPEFIEGINAWIGGICDSLSGAEHLHTDERLAAGSESVPADGRTSGPKDEVLWVTLQAGGARFLDRFDLPVGDAFPLAEPAWIRAFGDCRVTALTTAEIVEQKAQSQGLEVLEQAFLACWPKEQQEETDAELQRLHDELAYERTVQAEALVDLAVAMERPRRALLLQPGADALLAACSLVGNAQGIVVRSPRASALRSARDPLEAIARASKIRTRRVVLSGDWWRNDPGPLLGLLKEGHQPVALLPGGRGHYTAVDPVRGTTARADDRSVALDAEGYQFYRSLPSGALTSWNVVTFALGNSRSDLFRILLTGAAGGLVALFIPLVIGLIFGEIVPAGDQRSLMLVSLGLTFSVFAGAFFQVMRNFAVLRIEGHVDTNLQPAIWDRLLSLPVPFFRNYTAGDLAQRAMGIDAISQVVSGTVTSYVLSSVFAIFSFLLLFYYSVQLALVALALTLVTLVVMAVTGAFQLRYQRAQARIQGRISGLVLQFLTGISKLRVAGAEGRAFAVWAQSFGQERTVAVSAQTAANVLNTFAAFWPVVSFMVLFAAIASSPAGTNFNTATFLAFSAAFGQFFAAMFALGTAVTAILQVVPYFERVQPILDATPEVDEGKADPGLLNGDIEVHGVAFRYAPDSPWVLEDVTLHAGPGEFVALVGPSGSGKTSVFRLLLGFERPESGSIYFDGRDLADLDTEAIRRQIGTVIQSGKLQTGSIYENIVGALPLTLDDAWEAARMAGLEDDIRRMPMGMQTVVSEGASTFSGGQRQRLLIARAIVGRPRILLFDEATSALDNQTQATVTASLKSLQATRIVIAHRLSTIQQADRIYVFEGGRIVESGAYGALMEADGPFAQLARRQII
jgi:NHLM bacteriocin system ABC transporter ATP-binding protein